MTNDSSSDYPVQFRVKYPGGPRARGSVLVRILLAIPILIVASLISGPVSLENEGMTGAQAGLGDAGLAIATALMMSRFTYS